MFRMKCFLDLNALGHQEVTFATHTDSLPHMPDIPIVMAISIYQTFIACFLPKEKYKRTRCLHIFKF